MSLKQYSSVSECHWNATVLAFMILLCDSSKTFNLFVYTTFSDLRTRTANQNLLSIGAPSVR